MLKRAIMLITDFYEIWNFLAVSIVVVKMAPTVSGLELRIVSVKSGALPACPFPAGTLIYMSCSVLFVHCAHFIALTYIF